MGDEVAHWRRILWTSLQGFLSLEKKMTLPADHDESMRLLMKLFVDGLERVSAENDAQLQSDMAGF